MGNKFIVESTTNHARSVGGSQVLRSMFCAARNQGRHPTEEEDPGGVANAGEARAPLSL